MVALGASGRGLPSRGPALPCFAGVPSLAERPGGVSKGYTPEHHSVVEVADGRQAGHGPLRGKARLHKGPRVEHAQEPVDDDLGGGGCSEDPCQLAGSGSPRSALGLQAGGPERGLGSRR